MSDKVNKLTNGWLAANVADTTLKKTGLLIFIKKKKMSQTQIWLKLREFFYDSLEFLVSKPVYNCNKAVKRARHKDKLNKCAVL